ncbi:MAG: magnesium-translocating P-type ATPase [Actinomycetales bacterium]|nr:magnesium-translocating P-type ATPase [Actinomycetales bacterium]
MRRRPRRAARAPAPEPGPDLAAAAATPAEELLAALHTSLDGLSPTEVARRTAATGANIVHAYTVRWPRVLLRQFASPLLLLLAATCVTAAILGEAVNAGIIAAILVLSAGLGFFNDYRAERAAADLHARVQDTCTVTRAGQELRIPITGLVPGDIVDIDLGGVVPADLRLLQATGLECNESVLTGESVPAAKSADTLPHAPTSVADHGNCAFMGTVVTAGTGVGVVVATGPRAHFGRLALSLGLEQPMTGFQLGLQRFSALLLTLAGMLSGFVFLASLLLHRPVIDAVLFSLAIAVGITPEMLPAVVTISLSRGARQLAERKVIVKRLICIEDLGDVQVLFTDKTGTLTAGELTFEQALGARGAPSESVARLGLLATASAQSHTRLQAGHSALDAALWAARGSTATTLTGHTVRATLPFDHDRRRSSVVVDFTDPANPLATASRLLVKGAPESVLAACTNPPADVQQVVEQQFARGARVIALAERPFASGEVLDFAAESRLQFNGLLIYRDVPKVAVADAVARLHALNVDVKVITGDNPVVAQQVCAQVGIESSTVVTAADLDAMDDDGLARALRTTSVFARVSPEQKQRIVRVQRSLGADVAFLGDGVNDALALHEADVGISVDTATDVAKDAADVVLVEKDLHVLADGIVEGRRVFANTIKYVAMGSSSNFGNMFSAAGASAFLPFLPMLPSQILLNNLLYDASQLAISTDLVDPEQLRRPSHWDLGMIRRYMLFFGLISSVFDFSTFALMLRGFDAQPPLFRSAWFIESLATQTLVIFAIRTRRRPFWRSRASTTLTISAVAAVVAGAALLWSPAAKWLGFQGLPWRVAASLAALVAAYLLLVELGKRLFIVGAGGAIGEAGGGPEGIGAPGLRGRLARRQASRPHQPVTISRAHHHQRRRARRFIHAHRG